MTNFPSYISIFDNALTKNECNEIISIFEENKTKQKQGTSGGHKIQPSTKKSTDISCFLYDGSRISEIISTSLKIYVRKYSEQYPEIDFSIKPWSCYNYYNLQKYNPNEGYFKTHCEAADNESSSRVLVWMFYLNDVKDGGTLFPSYNIGVNAVQGRLVIWPPYWTHTHRGQISTTDTKYIATGWHTFD